MGAGMREQRGDNTSFEMFAGCAAGLEGLVADEIRSFGGQVITTDSGGVRWCGNLESAYRSCLWSRFASRILVKLWKIPIHDEESLYVSAKNLPWDEHLTEHTSFAIDCTLSSDCPITHSRFAALKLKDALVDTFRAQTGARPSVKTDKPEIQLHLHIEKDQATISLDMSGESLHRRGYRDLSGKAPLKETLGAAIVALTGWLKEPEKTLIDPMCGTGTLLIEAAMMIGDCAPGLSRSYFGFKGWQLHDEQLWRVLVEEATVREADGINTSWPLLIGYDCDPVMVRAARKNVRQAGFDEQIIIRLGEVATLQPPDLPASKGTLVTNLPYGERLSEAELVTQLYRGYGRILRQRFSGWRVGVFIANPELTDSFGLVWDEKHRLYNGSIPCRLLTGKINNVEPGDFEWRPSPAEDVENSNEFGNRLRKNLKNTLRWATKEGLSCFRVYDRDLPDYNLSVDLYGKWVHIQEWAPPKTIDPQVATTRLHQAIVTVKEILGVRSDRVFLKTRQRQKGKSQYEKKDNKKKMYEVREGACAFLVNFTDYLDTGLFLDHRPVRQKIFSLARGKRFLNLFGYTGTASVHAALGGAASTTTVDLSANYLHWARMNFALNGLSEITNKVEKADCLTWLRECQAQFDLIFVDPPTFSNTKKEMRVFDIQKDHQEIITLAMSHLEKQGMMIFSTNFKQFELTDSLKQTFDIQDVTAKSVATDFARHKKIHLCWEIRHRT